MFSKKLQDTQAEIDQLEAGDKLLKALEKRVQENKENLVLRPVLSEEDAFTWIKYIFYLRSYLNHLPTEDKNRQKIYEQLMLEIDFSVNKFRAIRDNQLKTNQKVSGRSLLPQKQKSDRDRLIAFEMKTVNSAIKNGDSQISNDTLQSNWNKDKIPGKLEPFYDNTSSILFNTILQLKKIEYEEAFKNGLLASSSSGNRLFDELLIKEHNINEKIASLSSQIEDLKVSQKTVLKNLQIINGYRPGFFETRALNLRRGTASIATNFFIRPLIAISNFFSTNSLQQVAENKYDAYTKAFSKNEEIYKKYPMLRKDQSDDSLNKRQLDQDLATAEREQKDIEDHLASTKENIEHKPKLEDLKKRLPDEYVNALIQGRASPHPNIAMDLSALAHNIEVFVRNPDTEMKLYQRAILFFRMQAIENQSDNEIKLSDLENQYLLPLAQSELAGIKTLLKSFHESSPARIEQLLQNGIEEGELRLKVLAAGPETSDSANMKERIVENLKQLKTYHTVFSKRFSISDSEKTVATVKKSSSDEKPTVAEEPSESTIFPKR